MTDEQPTDLTARASAYLDGDTTPDQRAQVDGNPELLAEVERLRQVRAVLAQRDAAPISVRERHLAAALDVWDRMPAAEFVGDATPAGAESAAAAGQAAITSPTSLGDRRKRRGSNRILTVAAAAVIVLGGGIVATNFISSGSDDGNIASEPAAADQDLSAREAIEAEAAEELFAEADSADDAAEQDGAATAAPEAASTLTGGESSGVIDEDLEVLSSDDELAVFADDLNRAAVGQGDADDAPTAPTDAAATEASEDATAADDAPPADIDEAGQNPDPDPAVSTLPAPVQLCDLVTRIVGPALWETPGIFNEAVIVGIDDRTGDAVAYREEDCSEVARTPLQR